MLWPWGFPSPAPKIIPSNQCTGVHCGVLAGSTYSRWFPWFSHWPLSSPKDDCSWTVFLVSPRRGTWWIAPTGVHWCAVVRSVRPSFDINPSLYITSDRFSFTDKSSSESADDLDLSHCSLTLLLGYGTASYMFSVFVLLSRCSLNSSNIYLLQSPYSLYLYSTLTSS